MTCRSQREAPTFSFSTVIKKALSFPIYGFAFWQFKQLYILKVRKKAYILSMRQRVYIILLRTVSHHITQSKRFV